MLRRTFSSCGSTSPNANADDNILKLLCIFIAVLYSQWDIKVQYARPPLALEGGYEDWLLKYPASTTNPQAQPPRPDDSMDDMLGNAHRGGLNRRPQPTPLLPLSIKS